MGSKQTRHLRDAAWWWRRENDQTLRELIAIAYRLDRCECEQCEQQRRELLAQLPESER